MSKTAETLYWLAIAALTVAIVWLTRSFFHSSPMP